MARYLPANDPYGLRNATDIVEIEQHDFHPRTVDLPDGRTLRLFTTRARLDRELFEHLDTELGITPDALSPIDIRELTRPSFHASLTGPDQPIEAWEYMRTPDELAHHLAVDTGVELPDTARLHMHADSTLAEYADLHLDHLGLVFQVESLRRDLAVLSESATDDAAIASQTQTPTLLHHMQTVEAQLDVHRAATVLGETSPHELIGTLDEGATRAARVAELRSWPGGDHTRTTVENLDKAIEVTRAAAHHDVVDHIDRSADLTRDFSTDMSHARIREWSEQATGLGRSKPAHPEHQTTRAQARGIRYEPKPATDHVNQPITEPHARRVDVHPPAQQRRPSI
ncbi:hypothetical protein CH260_23900 [Rhodococcus sp. 05-2256-B2]|uniref:hypothetical protein n=1 Tax=unclassified Rhodococcus (in: high G+C Gram-positive bacteria) TaxID=192944 RepID=UPI000B9BB6F3|nr:MULTISPECIES: hypothetical protein [unclassified Rhodococcus (in: high G+C Gram-positive bacteria)]OZD86535.1 hypothetical protein CH257_26325 [Rhodococcus sp. 05-2256-B3]OZD90735.1 hypothetical protein CH260_23900 [Rhodococcus sp. 05-2256-B2]OZD94447.1 hypothetical protein CH258_00120 [Rhodococcus sp. 05-2256-B4]OZE07152.1 hypothetical protein CH285_04780 [Rhodococcus sp. 05-2256-B1]